MMGSGSYLYTQDSFTSDYDVHEVGVTVCGVQHVLWVLGVRVRPGTRYFPYNDNPTRAPNNTSLKYCLPSTDAFDRREKNSRMRMKVQGRIMQASFIDIHQVFAKQKVGYFSNRVVFKMMCWNCTKWAQKRHINSWAATLHHVTG